jgi:hypothetical protein
MSRQGVHQTARLREIRSLRTFSLIPDAEPLRAGLPASSPTPCATARKRLADPEEHPVGRLPRERDELRAIH